MIEETARVVQTRDGMAWVETRRQTACGSCSVNKGCGTGVLAQVFGQKTSRVRVLNPVDAEEGEEVIIGIREEALVRGSIAVYAVPLLSMMMFALGGEFISARLGLGEGDAVTIVSGIIGLVVGLAWLKHFGTRIARDGRYQPVILRKLGRPSGDKIAITRQIPKSSSL